MKPLKDLSWPHFKPTEILRLARSNPSLKASSTVYLHSGKATENNPSLETLSERASSTETPVRELSPRPVPDLGILTPATIELTPSPNHQKRSPTPKLRPRNTVPEPDFGGLASKSTKERKKSPIMRPALMRDGKENDMETMNTQLASSPSSPVISAKDMSASLEGLQVAVTAMGLRGSRKIPSRSISPRSQDSVNDLIQSRPDTPESELLPGALQADFKWGPSKRVSRIDVSESSMDESMNIFLPLSNTSNAVSAFPTIQTVTSSVPTIIIPEASQRTFDGPASISAATKDLSHLLSNCPTISEADEMQDNNGLPSNIRDGAKIGFGALETNKKLPSNGVEGKSISNDVSAKNILPSGTDMPETPVIAIPVETLNHPSTLAALGVPMDSTGLAPAPATPLSNLSKRQKMKVKAQRLIRRGRRIVLRKTVLTVVLGRQLAGPTVVILRTISKGGNPVMAALPIAEPVPVPISM